MRNSSCRAHTSALSPLTMNGRSPMSSTPASLAPRRAARDVRAPHAVHRRDVEPAGVGGGPVVDGVLEGHRERALVVPPRALELARVAARDPELARLATRSFRAEAGAAKP